MQTKALFEKRATAVGSYWLSGRATTALRQYLRGCATTYFKQASIGGEQEQGFEQAFSSLAYAYLKDKSPRLLDFIVGFQLVDRNEDNTKAVGVFGFKVGDQWLYAPTFFLNGDLKGHELLYIKKQDMFVPMKENWVNHLISKKPHVLGEGSSQDTHELGGLMPNLFRLTRPPMASKYGSDQPMPIAIQEWAKPFFPMAMALATKTARALYPESTAATDAELNFEAVVASPVKAAMASTAGKFDLRNALDTFPLLKLAYDKFYKKYPLIKAGFDRFYGQDFFLKQALAIKAEGESLLHKKAESFVVPPKKVKKKTSFSIIADPEPPVKKADLFVYALDVDADVEGTITHNKPELTDAEREKLLKDTVLIKDERDPHAKSMVYNTQVSLEMANPDATGLFEVLEKPGTFDEMLVLVNPFTGGGKEDFVTVIRKSDPRSWKNTYKGNLFTRQNKQPTDTDFRKWVDGLDGVESLKKGGTYVAINELGACTAPFRIKEDNGDGQYCVSWEDYVAYGERRKYRGLTSSELLDTGGWEDSYSGWDAKVWINKRKGSKLRCTQHEVSIPDTFKILKLKDPPKPKKPSGDYLDLEPCCDEGAQSDPSPIMPGNIGDIQLLLHKEASDLKVTDVGGGEVWVRSKLGEHRMTKKAAFIGLVVKHGLDQGQAKDVIQAAEACKARNVPARFYVKYAFGYPMEQGGGPNAPAFPEPMRGTEMNGPNSVASIYPQEEMLPVDEMSATQTDPSTYDPWYMPDQNSMQVAQEAASSGQKEVFDTTMISGMLKSVRQDSQVDRYLGDLLKALDKLGRILFMFYWHQEEFQDRYGKQDLPELEDSLRNAFEVLGDVCLFLKEKTVQGTHELAAGVGNQSEPSVTEAARN